MADVILANFDGSVFRPTQPISLEPNTPVRLTVESLAPPPGQPASFLRTARSLQLEGPPDWASHLDKYLSGDRS